MTRYKVNHMPDSLIEEFHTTHTDNKLSFWAESLESSILVISENEEVLYSNSACIRDFQIVKNEFVAFDKQNNKINHIRRLKDPINKSSWIKVSSLLELEYFGEKAHLVIIEKNQVESAEDGKIDPAKIDSLLGIMPGVVYRCDNDENRMMHFLSEGCYQLTGYPIESFIGKKDFSFSSLIHPEDLWRTHKEINTALKENRPFSICYRIRHANGEYRNVQEQGKGVFNSGGKVVALEGWIIDVSDQKRVEEALVESENHYRNLVEISPDGVVLVNSDGRILFSNHQLAKMLGVENESALSGKFVLDFLSASSKPIIEKELLHSMNQESIRRSNYQVQRLDGSLFPIEASIRAITGKDGTPLAYIGVVRDVSERQETLIELQNSEARYRAIVEDNPEMIIRFKPNGLITFANQALCSFLETTSANVIGCRLSEIPSQRFQRVAERLLVDLNPSMNPEISEHQVIGKNEEVFWYRWKTQPIRNDEGQFIEYQSIGEDITHGKRVELANMQSEQNLRTLMEAMKLFAVITDIEGNITFCNSHFLEITGYQKDEAMGINFYDHFIPKEDVAELKHIMLSRAKEGVIPQRNENMLLTKSREQSLISWNNTLLRDDEGKITAIASIGQDITEKYFTGKVQEILYKIAESTITSINLDELFKSIHVILLELMPAENFFIALYDPEIDLITFPYFVDQFDERPAPRKPGKGLTDHVLRTRKSLLVDPETFAVLEEEKVVEKIGSDSVDWIGIPLLIESRAIGVMVVQTYSEGVRFSKRDEQLLTFVSAQVAIAIERKRAEQALSTSTKRNELLIQASTDCIFLESLSGHILDCNKVAEEIYGYTREELLSMNVADLVLVDFLEDKQDYIKWQIEQGGRFNDIPNVRKDGSVFPVEVSTKITDVEGTKFAVAYVRDVTERKNIEKSIRESEAKFKALAQTAAAGIFINIESRFLYVNPMWCEIIGYSEEELLNTSVWTILNHGEGERIKQKYAELSSSGSEMIRFETSCCSKDGDKKWLDITAGFIDYQGRKATIGTVIDITNRKRREHDLEVMAKISDALRNDLTRDQVRTTILNELMDLLSIDGAIITTVEKEEGLPNLVKAIGCWAETDSQKLRRNEGLSGFIISTSKAYVNFDAPHDPYFAFPEMLGNLSTVAGVPLLAKGETIGSILIGSSRVIMDDELRLLKTIGDLAASAIHRSDLYEQTSVQASELKQAYDATLEGWAHALELRDKETQGHSLRITRMTLELAKRMGYAQESLENIRRGALLHDIGKMGVPDTILLKPGRLTEDEWAIMQKHPTYAYEMLSELPYFKEALDIPYCHHEWWDGSGYPRGLKGEQIPLAARIFAIVDAWDALVSDRPYRKAWTKKEALKHIIDQAGSHFDAEVVKGFVELMREDGL